MSAETHKKEFLKYTGANSKTLPKSFALWIDPQIRNVVVELNKMGFKTMLSCAGHKTMGSNPQIIKTLLKNTETGKSKESWYSEGYGYIIFYRRSYLKEPVLNILKKYGLTGIKSHPCKFHGISGVIVTFNPVGHINHNKNNIGSGIAVDYMEE